MSMASDESANWAEYRLLILRALERVDHQLASLNDRIDTRESALSKELTDMKVEIAMLKVKAALFGGVTALLTTMLIQVIVKMLPIS